MKTLILTVLCLTTFSLYAQDEDKMIYGSDGRRDVYESFYKDLSSSTAGMFAKGKVKREGENYRIKGQSLKTDLALCPEERFADQPSISECSGFLIAPDILLTAGHCMVEKNACANSYWIFDYEATGPNQINTSFTKDQVYSCKEILAYKFDKKSPEDYAVLRLDRTTGRTPLKARTSGEISPQAELIVVGHPVGLPTKIAEGGRPRSNPHPSYFVADLDTYTGNSGSLVYDAKNKTIEGILVRGDRDYIYDSKRGCTVAAKAPEGEGRGEDVMKITVVLSAIKDLLKN